MTAGAPNGTVTTTTDTTATILVAVKVDTAVEGQTTTRTSKCQITIKEHTHYLTET